MSIQTDIIRDCLRYDERVFVPASEQVSADGDTLNIYGVKGGQGREEDPTEAEGGSFLLPLWWCAVLFAVFIMAVVVCNVLGVK